MAPITNSFVAAADRAAAFDLAFDRYKLENPADVVLQTVRKNIDVLLKDPRFQSSFELIGTTMEDRSS